MGRIDVMHRVAGWLIGCGLGGLGVAPAAAQPEAAEPAGDRAAEGGGPRSGYGAAVREQPAEPAPEPKIVYPELLEYAAPVYPEAARRQGLEAEVKLQLTLDESGAVVDAQVIEPVGHGFDEAALAAARRLKFSPATRDGEPIAVKWGFKYRFELEPAPAEAAPEAAPPPGELSGQLRVMSSEAPLAGARVVAVAADGTRYEASTDDQGRFAFEGLPAGDYEVSVSAPGFAELSVTERVVAGEATELVYRLAPRTEGIEITVVGERPPREVTRRRLERREIERIPGTSGDALRSIQSLPGVARPPGLAGLLIIRGSAPQDTETFIDGTNVPLIYHFGGLSSVVPTELLDRIDFYPGNFGVRYGRVMGGIVDVGLRSPDTECLGDYGVPTDEQGCYHGMAQIDLIDARLLAQGPLGPLEDWSFAIGARRSWIDTWLRPVLEEAGSSVTSAPVYHDYQLIVDHTPNPGEKLSFRAFGADDELELIITDPAAQDPVFGGNLRFATSFYRGQVLYEAPLGPDVDVTAMFSAGRSTFDFSLGTLLFQLDSYPVNLRSEFGFKLSPRARLNAGIDFLAVPFEVIVRAPPPPRPGEPDPGPFATKPLRETRDESTAFRPAWYADLEWQPVERLRVVPGFRVDYARDSGNADFSPRFNARYDLIRAGDGVWGLDRRTTLKGGVGVYHQPPEFQETDPVFGTPNLLSNRSIHYALGVEQELTEFVEVSLEGFYKDLDRLVSREPSATGDFEYGNDGDGAVVGLETLLKYKPDARFFGWIAYTLSRSTRQDTADDEERLFEFDQTHNLIMLGSYRLGRGWEFGARFRIVSGPLATPVLGPPALPALYAADSGSYVPLQAEPFSRRLPLFHQLDVRVDKRWQFRTWRLSAYLDVQNVYNNQAAEALVYNYNFTQEVFQTGLPIVPSLGLRGEF